SGKKTDYQTNKQKKTNIKRDVCLQSETVLNGLFFHELENKRASYGPVDRFFFASRNWRGLFSCVIAKMIAIGLHTRELSKLRGCVKVKHYISACSKV
ncbi:hypothetical protein, partial [Streptococcus suis]